jgi:hypothetical protein
MEPILLILKAKCSQKGFASNSGNKVDTTNSENDLHDEARLNKKNTY